MNVAFVITGLATGGAEMMLYKLLEHGAGLRPGRVVALRGGGDMTERFRALGVRVDCLGMRPGLPDPLAVSRLACMLRLERPDVVSTWMYHADLIGGLAARLAGIPVVWNIRHSDLDPRKTKFTTRLVVRACASLSSWVPQKMITNSDVARHVHVGLGYDKSRFAVIPNGFDLDRFHPSDAAQMDVRSELGLVTEARLVGLIARFDPQKNHLGFLQAAQRLRRRCPGVYFLLAGSGVSAENVMLRSAIERLGLQDAVFLLGRRDDIPRLMAALDVLVSSSYGEAFPNVLGEAMACGVPCVVTDVGDSALIVGDTGIVVPPGDMAGLAEEVRRILDMPPEERRSLGERARTRVAERFEIGAIVQRYEALFKAVAEGA